MNRECWVNNVVALGCLLLGGIAASCSSVAPVGEDLGSTASVAQPLEASQWPLEALVATNSIEFQDRAAFTGDVAATRASAGPFLSSNAEMTLGANVVITGNVKADTLVIPSSARITGNGAYNTVQGTGIIGTRTTSLAVPLPITIPGLPAITVGAQNISIAANQTQTLVAGNYGTVSLASAAPSRYTHLSS
jgi:hypothetical protein